MTAARSKSRDAILAGAEFFLSLLGVSFFFTKK
jgi:hypothetical protein